MIEELPRVLAAIVAAKEQGRWQEVVGTIDEQFQRLVGADAAQAVQLSETELAAKVMSGEATHIVREKMLFLIRLFKEAGDVAVVQDQLEQGRDLHLKGLDLLLGTRCGEEPSGQADFALPVEAFTVALGDAPLPVRTQAMLMHYYRRMGAFAKAEDALFSLLEAAPDSPEVLDLGISFYERLCGQSNAALDVGNLPRAELEAGMAELQARKAALSRTHP